MPWTPSGLLRRFTANKLRLEMRFDAILKSKKSSRPKKRKNEDDVLDRYADEEVARLREAMLNAAADDEQANRDKQPATNKLKLLPQVMEVLRKYVRFPVTSAALHNVFLQTVTLTVNNRQ